MALEKILKNSSGVPTGEYERIAGGTLYADSPLGTILPFGGSDAPAGWMLCQGQALSRITYADLFAVIGTSFGAGDGSTTFNIPDLRGEFLRGAGTNSHSGQGDGGSVGTHQNGTTVVASILGNGYGVIYNMTNGTVNSSTYDKWVGNSGNTYVHDTTQYETESYADAIGIGKTRPTNTSVNYIIKAKMVEVPADFLAKVGEVCSGKADKVSSATAGDIATLDANGNLVDSGLIANYTLRRVPNPTTAVDCNDLIDPFTEYRVGDGDANRPTTGQEAYIIRTFRTGTTSTVYSQIAYQIAGTTIYRRRRFNDTTWSPWEKLVTESEFKSYGIKTIWTGSKTKGDTDMNFDASPYDLCFARVGGTWCRLITGVGSESTTRKKFTAVYAGRDTPNGTPYEQYYLFDILNDGTVATCGWFNVGSLNIQNAKSAAQQALELAIAGTSTWTDPTWKTLANVETSVSVTQIIGIKFPTKA